MGIKKNKENSSGFHFREIQIQEKLRCDEAAKEANDTPVSWENLEKKQHRFSGLIRSLLDRSSNLQITMAVTLLTSGIAVSLDALSLRSVEAMRGIQPWV